MEVSYNSWNVISTTDLYDMNVKQLTNNCCCLFSAVLFLIAFPWMKRKSHFFTIFQTVHMQSHDVSVYWEHFQTAFFSERRESATRREAYLWIPNGWGRNFLVTYLEQWMWMWFSRDRIISLEFMGLQKTMHL